MNFVYVVSCYNKSRIITGVYDNLESARFAITFGEDSDFETLVDGMIFVRKSDGMIFDVECHSVVSSKE